MFAKKVIFALWGAAFASIWWAVSTLNFPIEGKVLLALISTIATGVGFAFNASIHWNDK